ncbi:MAG: hypothetical protein ACRD17_04230 [Terriglobales bacterium]
MSRFTHLAFLAFLAPALALPLAAQRAAVQGGGPAGRATVSRPRAAATALRAARRLRRGGGGGQIFITPTAVSFNATDPASQPAVGASAPVQARIFVSGPSATTSWSLSVSAASADFTGGGSTIPVSAVTYASTGTVKSGNGTVTTPSSPTPLSTTATTVASGAEGTSRIFLAQVTCNFVFDDSWNYVPGTYTQTVTFTFATL